MDEKQEWQAYPVSSSYCEWAPDFFLTRIKILIVKEDNIFLGRRRGEWFKFILLEGAKYLDF